MADLSPDIHGRAEAADPQAFQAEAQGADDRGVEALGRDLVNEGELDVVRVLRPIPAVLGDGASVDRQPIKYAPHIRKQTLGGISRFPNTLNAATCACDDVDDVSGRA